MKDIFEELRLIEIHTVENINLAAEIKDPDVFSSLMEIFSSGYYWDINLKMSKKIIILFLVQNFWICISLMQLIYKVILLEEVLCLE